MPADVTPSDLLDYARPTLAVDIALLTVLDLDGPQLVVVLQRPASGDGDPAGGAWRLPGSLVREEEQVRDAVTRTLLTKTGMRDIATRQLGVFDAPGRDPRGWVVSAAHGATVTPDEVARIAPTRSDVAVAPVEVHGSVVRARLPGGQRALPYDHQAILDAAVADLRERYDRAPDPDGLLGETFTLRELRRVHEAVEGRAFQKDTFNRQVLPVLVEAGAASSGTVGRPASLYRRSDREPVPMSLRVSGRRR